MIKISWKQFEKDIAKLARKLPKNKFTRILAISSGGLVPAYYLANLLDINRIDVVRVKIKQLPSDEEKGIVVVSPQLKNLGDTLVVDDLIDTGMTLQVFKTPESKVTTAVLYKKPHSPKKLADYVVRDIGDDWVVFPWERTFKF